MRRESTKRKRVRTLTAEEFDRKFDNNEDITPWLDFDKAVVVHRVNVDFPVWMIQRLDREATKLNISRQAVIKMWINERLSRSSKSA